MSEKVELTRRMILDGRTPRGSWRQAQLDVFGVTIKDNSGWLDRLIGRVVEKEDYDRFVYLGTDEAKFASRKKKVSVVEGGPTVKAGTPNRKHIQRAYRDENQFTLGL